jgi:hypothetical protein
MDLDAARSRGYRPDPVEEQRQLTIRNAFSTISVEAGQVWLGDVGRVGGLSVPDGGCVGEAQRQLGAEIPADIDVDLVENLAFSAFKRSESDSRIEAATVKWAECMLAVGYQYAAPSEAAGDPRWAEPPDHASPAEIAVATADVECKHKVNFGGVWLAVESAYQMQRIEENAERLNELKAWRDGVAAAAARVVAGR